MFKILQEIHIIYISNRLYLYLIQTLKGIQSYTKLYPYIDILYVPTYNVDNILYLIFFI